MFKGRNAIEKKEAAAATDPESFLLGQEDGLNQIATAAAPSLEY